MNEDIPQMLQIRGDMAGVRIYILSPRHHLRHTGRTCSSRRRSGPYLGSAPRTSSRLPLDPERWMTLCLGSYKHPSQVREVARSKCTTA